VVVEEEIQQSRNVSDVQDVSVSHQLQEQLQQANETIEKLLHQPKPSLQSQSKYCCLLQIPVLNVFKT